MWGPAYSYSSPANYNITSLVWLAFHVKGFTNIQVCDIIILDVDIAIMNTIPPQPFTGTSVWMVWTLFHDKKHL